MRLPCSSMPFMLLQIMRIKDLFKIHFNHNHRDFYRQNFLFILILIVLIALKFYLIRHSDVLAHPRDTYFYMLIAKQKIWFPEDIRLATLPYRLGYPIFIVFSRLLNIPLRISSELFYTFSNLLLILGLRLLKIPRFICVLCFLVLTFHLSTLLFFNQLGTESIVVSIFNIIVALMVFLITTNKMILHLFYSSLIGLSFGFLVITRREEHVVYLLYILLASSIIIITRKNIHLLKRHIVSIIIMPIIICLILKLFTTQLNYLFLGIPSLSFPESSAFNNTIEYVRNIDTQDKEEKNSFDSYQLLDNTITRKQLRKAYQASPTLNKLAPFIEASFHEKIKPYFKNATYTDTSDVTAAIDITQWSLYDGIKQYTMTNEFPEEVKAGKNPNYQTIYSIEGELKDAFENNIISRKNKVFYLNFREAKITATNFKKSITKIVNFLLYPEYTRKDKALSIIDNPGVTEEIASTINEVAGRRVLLLGMKNSTLARHFNQSRYIIHYLNIMGVLSYIILIIYYLRGKLDSPLLRKYAFIILFFLLLVVFRILLYTIIDMFFFKCFSRYLFPNMPLFSALSLLNIWVVFNLIRSEIKYKYLSRL
jgi:hypothetical protein